jgi:pilus assembly protein Flp/PilA
MLLIGKRFLSDESGATAIEYGLICAFLAVALIGILSSLGGAVSSEFGEVSSALK